MNSKHEYKEEFKRLDGLLEAKITRGLFNIEYAEFMKMCKGNTSAAKVLARIFYWWRPNQNGGSKFKVHNKDGNLVLVKSAAEMAIETGMSQRTVQRAMDRLRELEFISTETIQFKGHQTTSITLDEDKFVEKFWEAYIIIRLEQANHELKLTGKWNVTKITELKNRIAFLQRDTFDPWQDYICVESNVDEKYIRDCWKKSAESVGCTFDSVVNDKSPKKEAEQRAIQYLWENYERDEIPQLFDFLWQVLRKDNDKLHHLDLAVFDSGWQGPIENMFRQHQRKINKNNPTKMSRAELEERNKNALKNKPEAYKRLFGNDNSANSVEDNSASVVAVDTPPSKPKRKLKILCNHKNKETIA
jgi:hypothetical protein